MNDEDVATWTWFDQRLPLIGQQMLTGERVMSAVGHACDLWLTPRDSQELAILMCLRCEAQATIQYVAGANGADYTVLLLPAGSCTQGENHAR